MLFFGALRRYGSGYSLVVTETIPRRYSSVFLISPWRWTPLLIYFLRLSSIYSVSLQLLIGSEIAHHMRCSFSVSHSFMCEHLTLKWLRGDTMCCKCRHTRAHTHTHAGGDFQISAVDDNPVRGQNWRPCVWISFGIIATKDCDRVRAHISAWTHSWLSSWNTVNLKNTFFFFFRESVLVLLYHCCNTSIIL